MTHIGPLPPQDMRLILCLMAFTTPYLLEVSYLLDSILVRFYAPLWTYSSLDFPAFRILSLDYLIFEFPFGLVKLLFVQQVYLFMIHQTSFRRMLLYGIATEIPGTVFAYLFSGGYIVTPYFIPVPIMLALGLFIATRTPKRPLDWLDKKQPDKMDLTETDP
ncbi:MAG: hypothetical protein ACFE7R_07865 [Candidatus Hodarchaeota archaeon]